MYNLAIPPKKDSGLTFKKTSIVYAACLKIYLFFFLQLHICILLPVLITIN